MKTLNITSGMRIVDERGFATSHFLRALDILVNRTGGIGGDAGSDEFTLQSPPFGDVDALSLEQGYPPPAEPESPDIPIVMQPSMSGEAWPVGSIFIAAVSTNPRDLLGYGTWAAFGAGRVLVGLDGADPSFNTLEGTGGAKTAAISAHAGTAVADHPPHAHPFTQSGNAATPDLVAADTTGAGVAATGNTGDPTITLSHTVTQPNDHDPVSVVQPYIVVALWKRTA